MIPRASYLNDGTVALSFPYRRELVEALKYTIPANDREWDPVRKLWLVASYHDHVALNLVRQYFPNLIVTSEAAERRARFTVVPPEPANDPDRSVLTVTNDAPIEVISAAYRAWSKLVHPDRGGDPDQMRRINAAYERLTSAAQARTAS